MKHRIGLIGAGFLTRAALLPALAARDSPLTAAAVLDPDAQALQGVRTQFPDVAATSDEEAFFGTDLDAVHIATPNATHADLAVRALSQGLAVLVDKPLADTVAAGQRIVAAARTPGSVAMIGYMSKYNAHNRAAAALVESGAIGEPLSMTALHLGHQSDGWRTRRAESGLGCLGDLGIYAVATASDLFGTDPTACRATAFPAHDPRLTELHAEGTVEFAGSRTLHVECSFTEEPAVGVSRYTVTGSQGALIVRDSWAMNAGGQVLLCDRSGRRTIPVEPADPYLAQYRQFAACLQGEPVPERCGVVRGLHDLAVLAALHRSAAACGSRLPFTEEDS